VKYANFINYAENGPNQGRFNILHRYEVVLNIPNISRIVELNINFGEWKDFMCITDINCLYIKDVPKSKLKPQT